jgi:Uma2 family endonuclease
MLMIVKAADDLPSLPAPSQRGELTWEIALLYPPQGEWTEAAYLALDAKTRCMIELSDGCLEFLPMPTLLHAFIARFLFEVFHKFVSSKKLGEVLLAPLPVHLWPGKYREPDLLFLRPERLLGSPKYPEGADLVLEVVSEGEKDRKRDFVEKPQDYAKAGVAEYWIVDPQEERITVLTLDGPAYRQHGVFRPGEQASSVLLPGFAVDVAAVFAAGKQAQ